MRPASGFGADGNAHPPARADVLHKCPERTNVTARLARQTNQGTKIHECLVEIASATFGQVARGDQTQPMPGPPRT